MDENEARLFKAFEAGWDAYESTRAHRKTGDSYNAAFKTELAAYMNQVGSYGTEQAAPMLGSETVVAGEASASAGRSESAENTLSHSSPSPRDRIIQQGEEALYRGHADDDIERAYLAAAVEALTIAREEFVYVESDRRSMIPLATLQRLISELRDALPPQEP